MNCYLGIVSKKGPINAELEEHIRKLARTTLFDYAEPTHESIHFSQSGLAALFIFSNRGLLSYASNENAHFPFSRYAFANTGYPMDDVESLLRRNGCDKRAVSQLGGVFSIAVLDKHNDVIRAYNNHMRLELVFYAENDDFYLVGTRAMMLHLLVTGNKKPEIDRTLLTSFLHRGYWPCSGSPFIGVNEVPLYSEIHLSESGISITSIDNCKEEFFTKDATDEYIDMMAQALLDAGRYVKPLCKGAKLGLTGGKDSRMVLLSMIKNDIDILTETGGYDESPDVIVARQIASIYGLPHSTYQQSGTKDVFEIDLLARAQQMAFASDCMLYAFEGCGSSYGGDYRSDFAMLNGLGGEILRGGYAKRLRHLTARETKGRIKRLSFTVPEFFLPGVDDKYAIAMNERLNGYSNEAPEAMEWLYLNVHMGKWASTTMRCWNMRRLYVTPLCDERLIKLALKLKTSIKVTDYVMFEIIRRIDDRMIDVPLADGRWSFEATGPLKGDILGYNKREPVVAKTRLGAFSWRHTSLTDMRDNMKSVIFDSSCAEIFDYLDRSKVAELFSSNNEQYLENPFYRVFAWYIYSACVMLEGSWFTNHRGATAGFSDFARTPARVTIPKN